VGGRGAAFVFQLGSADPAVFDRMPAAADRLIGALDPWLSAENQANFLGAPRSPEHLASAWPASTRARLAEVRQRIDPTGRFA
jgi:hypothetical protein